MGIRIEIRDSTPAEDPASLRAFVEIIMNQVSDAITRLSASLDAAIAGISARLAALESQVAAGADTPQILASLAATQAKLDAFLAANPGVVAPPGVATTNGATTAGAMPAGASP